MKKIISFIAIVFCAFNSYACDICGCGVGNYYIGLMPQFSKSFVGLRYQFSRFHTNIKGDASQYSKDLFETVEVWGGLNIGTRWQVIAIIPINRINQVSDDGTLNHTGLGDVAVMGNYKLFNKVSSTKNKKLLSQTLWLGAGIKTPTGKFNVDASQTDLAALANTQVGSGSTDFILNANYIISINRWGFSNNVQFKINNSNRYNYNFGNKFSANSIAYYTFSKASGTITPNAGLLFTQNQSNKFNQTKVTQTAGYVLSSAAGVEVNFKKLTVGCNVQIPLAQRFAHEQTNTKLKGMFHITFSL